MDPDRDPEDEPVRGFESHLAVFFEDSALWPVLAVAVAIFVTGGAALLLLAAVEHNPFALAALLLLLWMSVDVMLRQRRSGGSRRASAAIACLWALSGAVALMVQRMGFF